MKPSRALKLTLVTLFCGLCVGGHLASPLDLVPQMQDNSASFLSALTQPELFEWDMAGINQTSLLSKVMYRALRVSLSQFNNKVLSIRQCTEIIFCGQYREQKVSFISGCRKTIFDSFCKN